MSGYIYRIFNKVNNLCYIGLSVNIKRRFIEHKHSLNKNNHYNPHLQNSWNKYGKNNFIFQIVEKCDLSILEQREIFYINLFKSFDKNYGYNLTTGGNRPKLSETTRLKMSKSKTGKKRKFSREHLKNMSLSRIGKKLTQEHKNKLSERLKGKNHPLYGKLHPNRKKIKCLETNLIYESALDASKKLNLDASSINKVCLGKRKKVGGLTFVRILEKK